MSSATLTLGRPLASQRGASARALAPFVLALACAACATAGAPDREPSLKGGAASSAAGLAGAAPTAGVMVWPSDAATAPHGYWADVRRRLPRSPSGRSVAVACHNCYRQDLASPAENLAGTVERIAAAMNDGADIIELDVRLAGDAWYVGHSDRRPASGALLQDVLRESPLAAGDQLLFVEIKEAAAPRAQLRALLQLLTSSGIAGSGRYAIVRAFAQRSEQLWTVERLLADAEFADAAAHVRTHVLFKLEQALDPEIHSMIEVALDSGADGVEFNHKAATARELLEFARARGLGTNVWTFPEAEGTDLCRAYRELSDALTTESPPALCRAAIERP